VGFTGGRTISQVCFGERKVGLKTKGKIMLAQFGQLKVRSRRNYGDLAEHEKRKTPAGIDQSNWTSRHSGYREMSEK